MTTKPTGNNTPDTEELNDADLDKVQGGWSWGETNEGSKVKKRPKGGQLTHDPVFEELKKDKNGNIQSPTDQV